MIVSSVLLQDSIFVVLSFSFFFFFFLRVRVPNMYHQPGARYVPGTYRARYQASTHKGKDGRTGTRYQGTQVRRPRIVPTGNLESSKIFYPYWVGKEESSKPSSRNQTGLAICDDFNLNNLLVASLLEWNEPSYKRLNEHHRIEQAQHHNMNNIIIATVDTTLLPSFFKRFVTHTLSGR